MSDTSPTGEVVAPPAAPVSRGKRRNRGTLTVIGALLLVGAGVGGYVAAAQDPGGTTASGGAASPALAVQSLIDSVNKGDLIGTVDALVPGERVAIAPFLNDLAGQLTRLHVLSSSNLSSVSGVQIQLKNITIGNAHEVARGVDAVPLSGGVGSSYEVNFGELPVGGILKQLGVKTSGSTGETAGSSISTSSNTVLATVDDNGRWYVSLGWTIALNAMHGEPPPANGIAAVGASSPAGAVTDFFSAIAHLNLSQLIATLPPGEFGALQAYAPNFLPKAQSEIDTLVSQYHVSLSFPGLTTTTSSLADGDELVAVSTGVSVQATVKGYATTITFEHDCFTLTISGSNLLQDCAGHQPTGLLAKSPLLSRIPAKTFTRSMRAAKGTGFVAVEENGSWYVSPTATILQDLNAELAVISPANVQAIINDVRHLKNIEDLGSALE